MSTKKSLLSILSFLSVCLSACEQSDPPPLANPDDTGDFHFSGYYWNIKNSNDSITGPGSNYFANSADNVWLDQDSLLHLRITRRNNKWYCSEVISSKEFGYGTYVFTIVSDLTTINEKTVFGLFTWSDYTFMEQANSEVDIEFSHWNNINDSLLLTYSVQPVWFDNPSPYVERTRRPQIPVRLLKTVATHVFTWTPDSISWNSYEGDQYPAGNKFASWYFDRTNPARTKMEGGRTSMPIVIPAPLSSTNVRFNLWLLNGQAPSDGRDQEVIIKRFRYFPL